MSVLWALLSVADKLISMMKFSNSLSGTFLNYSKSPQSSAYGAFVMADGENKSLGCKK
jgi:hypothetical protein